LRRRRDRPLAAKQRLRGHERVVVDSGLLIGLGSRSIRSPLGG
jgi:hypothetical protein